MAQEDVEVVREAFETFNRGDREAWIAMCAEDAELYSLRAQLEGNPYRGHDGIELNNPAAMVLATRGGKVSYARFYSNPADALEAAGLSD